MPVAKAAMSYVTQTAKNHKTEVAKLFIPKSSLLATHVAIPRKYLGRCEFWTVCLSCKFGCKVRCPRSADGPGGYQFSRRLMRPNERIPSIRMSETNP
jgi:adenine C2-methylase RlmN of 23S rRNA A2503 and tRNA A37